MLNNEFQNHLSVLLDQPIQYILPVSGGDISMAYRVETKDTAFFLKVNQGQNALHMFQTEKSGLETIAQTKSISTPKIIACETFKTQTFILMEFIESKRPNAEDFGRFGKALAVLHQNTSENFGFRDNNFIGSLPQSNKPTNSWVNFYINERLKPQFDLAKRHGLLTNEETPAIHHMEKSLEPLFKDVKPSLLHGDLWSGNYLITKDGLPYLIDPAVYYGHSEVDIAMTQLFGGFSDGFYEAYYSVHPKDSKTASRIEIYQLYYLLVHLNLFGSSYYGSFIKILKKYF